MIIFRRTDSEHCVMYFVCLCLDIPSPVVLFKSSFWIIQVQKSTQKPKFKLTTSLKL